MSKLIKTIKDIKKGKGTKIEGILRRQKIKKILKKKNIPKEIADIIVDENVRALEENLLRIGNMKTFEREIKKLSQKELRTLLSSATKTFDKESKNKSTRSNINKLIKLQNKSKSIRKLIKITLFEMGHN